MRQFLYSTVSALCIPLFLVPVALAQDETDDFAGFRKLTFTPSVALTQSYDDNIYTETNDTNGDFITNLDAKLKVDASFENLRKLQFNFGINQEIYADNANDNRLDYNAGVLARSNLSDGVVWTGSADFRHAHNNRGDNETDPTASAEKAPAYDMARAKTSLNVKANQFTFKPRLGLAAYTFKDYNLRNGSAVDQDYRDRIEYIAGGRLSYGVLKTTDIFIDAEYAPNDYDVSGTNNRDSNGSRYLTGIAYKPSKNLSAEFGIGYMNRTFDRASFDNIHALATQSSVNWSYEDGGRVRISLERSIGETTQMNVGGTLRTGTRVSITKNLAEDLTGKLDARYFSTAYQGGLGATGGAKDRTDNLFGFGAELEYQLNEKLALTADYNYVNNGSNQNSAEYTKNVFLLGMKYLF